MSITRQQGKGGGGWPYEDVAREPEPTAPTWQCPKELCNCSGHEKKAEFEFSVLLCSEDGERMPGARCRILIGGKLANRTDPTANAAGWVTVVVPRPIVTMDLEWAPANTPADPRYPYRVRFNVELGTDRERAGWKRLSNLGFGAAPSLRAAVRRFQRHYCYSRVTGELNDIENDLVQYHDVGLVPVVREDSPAAATGGPDGDTSPPRATTPPQAPPAAPPSRGRAKTGGGALPGQGTARPARRVPRALRFLDYNLRPAASVPAEVLVDGEWTKSTTDAQGFATVRISEHAGRCTARWLVPTGEGADPHMTERNNVLLQPIDANVADDEDSLDSDFPGLPQRLRNIGHLYDTLEQQVRSYQVEMGRDESGAASDVESEVRNWHDGGPTPGFGKAPAPPAPNAGNVLGQQSGPSKGSPPGGRAGGPATSILPLPGVIPYAVRGDDPAPFVQLHRGDGRINVMDILRGQHSAITFIDSNGVALESQNPQNAVPSDAEVWVDGDPTAKSRHVFFHGTAMPNTDQRKKEPHVSLFLMGPKPPPDRRTAFQVRVLNIDNPSLLLVKLYGRSMAFNEPGVRPHMMDKTVTEGGLQFSEVVSRIEKEVKSGGPLIHLVINAHARDHGGTHGPSWTVHLGGGISRADHEEWKRLRGKVKYIWFQACQVAQDRRFCATIAHNTEAWVVAYDADCLQAPVSANHVNYDFRHARHFDGKTVDMTPKSPTQYSPAEAKQFYRAARHRASNDLAKSLHFNIIRLL